MMFIVLDKNPIVAAQLLPKSIRHKQLLELMQMLSCTVNFGYKQLGNGKKIKEWIDKHKKWTYIYANKLYSMFCCSAKNPKKATLIKYQCLLDLLRAECEGSLHDYERPTTAIFRYVEEYDDETSYVTNSELPIDVAVEEYKKYVKWKSWKN